MYKLHVQALIGFRKIAILFREIPEVLFIKFEIKLFILIFLIIVVRSKYVRRIR